MLAMTREYRLELIKYPAEHGWEMRNMAPAFACANLFSR